MKIIAFYLPQFYVNPQNDEWWGEGFTEWTNTKKAEPLFYGHYQPRIPLHHKYYDLNTDEAKLEQVKLAKEYGIYGFSYYHYWFKDGQQMLEKPAEQMLKNKEIDLPFCFCWANEAWSRRWDGSEQEILMEQDYGTQEDWEKHFYYLLPFFKDERYIKIDEKFLFVIYRPELISCLKPMLNLWQQLAKQNGIAPLVFSYQHPHFHQMKNKEDELFTYAIETQPGLATTYLDKYNLLFDNPYIFFHALKRKLCIAKKEPLIFDYDKVWKIILRKKPLSAKSVPCAFTDWDNSARRGIKSIIFKGAAPKKFEYYMTKLIKKTKEEYHKELLFINAWNEWAEGAYLEPDERYDHAYLQAVKNALEKNGYKITENNQ